MSADARPVIAARDLRKTFRVARKRPGLAGSLRAIVRPERADVHAVRGLSFTLEAGELLGFIGPNGAGKSTTIKMLTGILHPSSGTAEVLGHVPWRDRRRLAYEIGTVFGQRPQLWFHLPAIDTLRLFGRVYELDDALVDRRIALLAETFEIGHLLETPVRKLSLGQRMRCEIAASLLHAPRLVLLDEPSIGLDVVVKQRIRDTIREMNAREGVAVLLTSHDAGDIEALCKRVIIVNHGRVIYDDRVSALKRTHLTHKVVGVRYAEPPDEGIAPPGLEVLKAGRDGHAAKLAFDTRDTAVDDVIHRLAALGPIADLTITDPPLEDVIRAIYLAADEAPPEAADARAGADADAAP